MNTRSKNRDSTKLSPKVPGKISSYFERESLDSNSEVNMEERLSKLIEQSSRSLMDNLNKFKDELMVKFDALVSENDILREKVTELEKGLQFAQERAEESVQIADRCVKENSELTDKFDKIESSWLIQFSTIRAEKKALQEALNKLERYTREWNLRFSGFEEINGEDCKSKIVEFISENQLFPGSIHDIYNKVEVAHRTGKPGKKANSSFPRHIIARFNSRNDRNKVFFTAKEKYKGREIRILDDLTKSDYSLKKRAIKQMEMAYQAGKRVSFRRGQLRINGIVTAID